MEAKPLAQMQSRHNDLHPADVLLSFLLFVRSIDRKWSCRLVSANAQIQSEVLEWCPEELQFRPKAPMSRPQLSTQQIELHPFPADRSQ